MYKRILPFIGIIAFCPIAFSQASWNAKASFPAVNEYGWSAIGSFNAGSGPMKRVGSVGFSVGNYGYLFGGTDLTNEFADLHLYDPGTNSWVKKASMPTAGIREPAAFVINGLAYVGLGFKAGVTKHLAAMYKYDPNSNTWTAIASFYQGRRAASGFAIDSLGYIIGGFEYGYNPDNSLYMYSPTLNKWTKKATMPGSARSYPSTAVVGGKAYVMGGLLPSGGGYVNDFYMYDPTTDKWTTLTNFPGTARTTASTFVLGDVIYIGNGKNATTHFSDWYGYDTKSSTWFKASNFISNRVYGNVFFTVANKGYIATGAYNTTLTDTLWEFSGKSLGRVASVGFSDGKNGYVFGGSNLVSDFSDLHKYDVSKNTWSQLTGMPTPGVREPAAFVIDSFAYVGLGFKSGANSHISTMYKYNMNADKWTQIQSFYEGRRAAVGFAIDSLGYIFGGFELTKQADNSLYSYNPKTNKWTQRSTMPGSGRSYPLAGVVNGKAYMMGGLYAGGSSYTADFYSYNPQLDQWTKLADFPGNGRAGGSSCVIGDIVFYGCGKAGNSNFTDWWGYNTKTAKWFSISSYPGAYTYGKACFSANGKGFVTTGALGTTMQDSTYELSFLTSSIVQLGNSSKDLVLMHYSFSSKLEILGCSSELVNVSIYTADGKIAFRKEMKISENAIELPALASGLYIVEVIENGKKATLKIAL